MDIKSTQLFLHLASTLHFSKTSQAMHVSPSTLSRCIQRLEEELGASLFMRNNRSVQLTNAGMLFKNYCMEQLASWEKLKSQARGSENELEGKINLFCSVTAAYSHLPIILDKFRKLHPKVEIMLKTGDSAIAIEKVLEHNVDFAITARPDNLVSSLHFKSLAEIPLSIISPTISCLTTTNINKASINWKGLPFILPEHGVIRQRFDLWYRCFKIGKPQIYATVAGHEALVSMVALGCGVGVVPDVVIESSPVRERVKIIQTQRRLQSFELGLCCYKARLSDPLINAFMQCVEN